MKSSRWAAILLAHVALLAGGCGPAAEERLEVRGQVFFQNEPLVHGTIVFTPDADISSAHEMAAAAIRKDGSFLLRTEDGAGVRPGHYRVSILSPGGQLPDRYRDPLRSGLARRVRGGEENVFEFRLE